MTLAFWVSAALVVYVYAGYPLVLAVWSRRKRNAHGGWRTADCGLIPDAGSAADCRLPSISIVLAARNEGTRLAGRIDNLLAVDFPPARRQIIVVLDGSTDDSAAVLERYRDSVEAVSVEPGGKASALNAAVSRARHDILVFADARQTFAIDALRELVAPFADGTVGGVSGELVLDAEAVLFANRRSSRARRRRRRARADRRRRTTSTIADGVGLYWRYEKALRRMESAVGSTLGATGAIYAIRRSLWKALPPGTLLDDVLAPMQVVLSGFRVVFTDRARAFDRAPADADAESQRKVRTLAGNYQLLALEPRLLLPWRNPVWLQFTSHKLGRLAVPYALLVLFGSSIALSASPLYLIALIAQVGFYLLAGCGAYLEQAARRTPPSEGRAVAFEIREVA